MPDLAISFSIRALLDGRIAPTRLELFGPRLRVVRQADGALTLGETQVPITAQPSAEEARLGSDLTADVLAHLAAPPDHKGPLGYLRSISLLNADFIFEDLREGVTIRAPGSDILLARDREGVGGNARLNILADGRRARIDLAGGYNPQRKALELEMHLDGMEPAVLAPLSPDLKVAGRRQGADLGHGAGADQPAGRGRRRVPRSHGGGGHHRRAVAVRRAGDAALGDAQGRA